MHFTLVDFSPLAGHMDNASLGGYLFLKSVRDAPTVGQFGPLGCRINSTSTFVIFCIRVDVSRVTSGYGEDMTPMSQVHLTPKNGGNMGVA